MFIQVKNRIMWLDSFLRTLQSKNWNRGFQHLVMMEPIETDLCGPQWPVQVGRVIDMVPGAREALLVEAFKADPETCSSEHARELAEFLS